MIRTSRSSSNTNKKVSGRKSKMVFRKVLFSLLLHHLVALTICSPQRRVSGRIPAPRLHYTSDFGAAYTWQDVGSDNPITTFLGIPIVTITKTTFPTASVDEKKVSVLDDKANVVAPSEQHSRNQRDVQPLFDMKKYQFIAPEHQIPSPFVFTSEKVLYWNEERSLTNNFNKAKKILAEKAMDEDLYVVEADDRCENFDHSTTLNFGKACEILETLQSNLLDDLVKHIRTISIEMGNKEHENVWRDQCVQSGATMLLMGSYFIKLASEEEDDIYDRVFLKHTWPLLGHGSSLDDEYEDSSDDDKTEEMDSDDDDDH